ncbi:MAG: hypothetical protein V3R87_02955 [Dehalococcoidia bacterium]
MIPTMKIRPALLVVAIVVFILGLALAQSVVLADSHEEPGSGMDMGEGSPVDSMDTGGMDMSADSTMGDMDTSGMDMAAMDMSTSKWQDQINKVSYPVTAVLALLTVLICIMLMRATGLTDKFGLVSAGLALFLVQSIVGVLYYVSNGSIVNMPTLMFVMSLFTSVALLLIGTAFYRWNRMISQG